MGELRSGKITLGRYMWERLHQVGVDTIFGVPGTCLLLSRFPIAKPAAS
jgi:hypothetical protein